MFTQLQGLKYWEGYKHPDKEIIYVYILQMKEEHIIDDRLPGEILIIIISVTILQQMRGKCIYCWIGWVCTYNINNKLVCVVCNLRNNIIKTSVYILLSLTHLITWDLSTHPFCMIKTVGQFIQNLILYLPVNLLSSEGLVC